MSAQLGWILTFSLVVSHYNLREKENWFEIAFYLKCKMSCLTWQAGLIKEQ